MCFIWRIFDLFGEYLFEKSVWLALPKAKESRHIPKSLYIWSDVPKSVLHFIAMGEILFEKSAEWKSAWCEEKKMPRENDVIPEICLKLR